MYWYFVPSDALKVGPEIIDQRFHFGRPVYEIRQDTFQLISIV